MIDDQEPMTACSRCKGRGTKNGKLPMPPWAEELKAKGVQWAVHVQACSKCKGTGEIPTATLIEAALVRTTGVEWHCYGCNKTNFDITPPQMVSELAWCEWCGEDTEHRRYHPM